MPSILPKAFVSLAVLTLAPRIPSLAKLVCAADVRALVLQAVVLAYVRTQPRLLERLPVSVVPLTVTLTLLASILQGKVRQGFLRYLVCLGAVPTLSATIDGGVRALTNGDADVPALLALQLGVCLGQHVAAAVILLMLTGGEALEEYAMNRAGRALHALLRRSPGTCNRWEHGQLVAVAAEDALPGDVLMVREGEVVPVDCDVVEPPATTNPGARATVVDEPRAAVVDESLLTGESMPSRKALGDRVLGGSSNIGGAVWLRVHAPYTASCVGLMQAQMRLAVERKAQLELKCKKFASGFTPFTLFVAAAGAWLTSRGQRAGGVRSQWETVLSVLMSATPCPAIIGVPVALLSGMSVANRRCGVTVKSGQALEALGRVRVVVLDKTGTLTRGAPSVRAWRAVRAPPSVAATEDDRGGGDGSGISFDATWLARSIVARHPTHATLHLATSHSPYAPMPYPSEGCEPRAVFYARARGGPTPPLRREVEFGCAASRHRERCALSGRRRAVRCRERAARKRRLSSHVAVLLPSRPHARRVAAEMPEAPKHYVFC